MKLQIHILGQVLTLSCGHGTQRIRWVAEAAALKLAPDAMFNCGEPKSVKMLDGTVLPFHERIADRLFDNAHVEIGFEAIVEPPAERKAKKKSGK